MAVIKMNGGYNALPISYKRGNPIPLDKSAVWYDYDAMVAYATTDPTAYVGQILSLVDANDINAAKAYIILDVAGNVEEIGNGALVDAIDSIELQLTEITCDLNTIKETLAKLVVSVGAPADGEVAATGLFAEVEKKANAADVYTKEQTDNHISSAVANAVHLKRKEVESIDLIDVNAEGADQYIYMVPSGLEDDDNRYYEYMIIEVEIFDSEGTLITTEKKLERVGSWAVDLSEYAKKIDVAEEKRRAEEAEAALADRIEDLELESSTLKTNLEQAQEDIIDINTALDNKVEKVYYTIENEDGTTSRVEGTLLTPEEKAKLSALSIDEDGSVGISGTVSVDNVQGLSTWLTDNGDTYIQNLAEENLSQETADKINFITAVDTSTFTVVNSTLNLKEVSADKVVGLTDLNTKVGNLETAFNQLKSDIDDETTGLVAVNTKIANLETSLNNYVTKVEFNKTVGNLDALLASNTTIIKQIEDINSRLTWQELS